MGNLFDRLNEGRPQQIEEALEQQRRKTPISRVSSCKTCSTSSATQMRSPRSDYQGAMRACTEHFRHGDNWLTHRKNRRIIPHWLGVSWIYRRCATKPAAQVYWVVAGVRYRLARRKRAFGLGSGSRPSTALQHRTSGDGQKWQRKAVMDRPKKAVKASGSAARTCHAAEIAKVACNRFDAIARLEPSALQIGWVGKDRRR